MYMVVQKNQKVLQVQNYYKMKIHKNYLKSCLNNNLKKFIKIMVYKLKMNKKMQIYYIKDF